MNDFANISRSVAATPGMRKSKRGCRLRLASVQNAQGAQASPETRIPANDGRSSARRCVGAQVAFLEERRNEL
jgi:hypothetical protein